MPYPSNALAVAPRSRTDASATRGMAPGTTRLPDILTYCYDSRMVCVARGESYDQAIAVAVETFPELADVERDRISLEVHILHGNQHEKKATTIGRSAWSAIVATLAQHEVVDIRVAPPPKSTHKSAVGSSTPTPPVPIIEPPTSETGWSSDTEVSQSHIAGFHEKSITHKSSQLLSDILTYCYDSRMVYVTRDEDYDRAIDIAIDSFPELRDVGRERICLEVRVVHGNHWQQEKEMTKIGRTAWSAVVATLAPHEVVGIRVAAPPKSTPKSIPKSAGAFSSSAPSVADPSPSKMGRYSDAEGSQTNLAPRRLQMPGSMFDPQSHSTGLRENDITPKSSQPPPDLLKYCYNSRMVYVTPGENYDQAIEIAQDSFPELAGVERNRIEVRVMHGNQQEKETTVISRTAWPVIVPTLARHEVVEIHVAPPPKPAPKSAMASSNPTPSVANLPRSEKGWSSDAEGSQMNSALRRPQMPSSMLGPQSHTTGLHEKNIIPKPSHLPPDILTYCYKSRTVYVTPGENYDQAIDIAQESFPELLDVERNRICLEVCVVHGDQKTTTEIGRTAWPIVVPTLGRHEVVEIRVAAVPPKSAPSVVDPPPSKTGSHSDAKGSQMNLVPRRALMPRSMLEPQSHITGLRETGFTPKTSQPSPNFLAYSYNSRTVSVTPAKDYNRAIDIAIEYFPELRQFERGQIYLEAHVKRNPQEKKTAGTNEVSWPTVVATPERYDRVEIRVFPLPKSAPKSSRGRPPQPSR